MTTNSTILDQIFLDDLLEDCGTMSSNGVSTGCQLTWPTQPISSIGSLGAITGLSDGGISTNSALHVKGDAKFDGDVRISGNLKIGDVDIGESLKRIEERIGLLRPNARLEKKWEELKKLGDRYRDLEAEILDGEQILRILGNPEVDE